MKKLLRAICLCLALCLMCTSAGAAEIFKLPYGIKTLESEALAGIDMPEGILLPESLVSIADDAFDDTIVYGVSGGTAEAYAQDRGLEFRSIDITNAQIDVPAFYSPYRSFNVSVSADSALPFKTIVRIIKDGEVCYQSPESDDGNVSAILYEGGLYDYSLTLYNDYTEAWFYFEGETEIYEPIKLISPSWTVAVDDTFCPIDETEAREVKLISDTDAFSIDGNLITAKRLGSYTLSATCDMYGDTVYTDFTVNVVIPVESLMLSEGEVELYEGEVYAPEITALPSDASNYELIYETSNADVATVDENGEIHAVSRGECVISISTFDAQVKLNVKVKKPIETLEIIKPDSALTLISGEKYGLDYTVLPEDSDDIEVIWHSSDEKIVSVDSAGYLSANRAGSADIYAVSAANSKIRDVISITVLKGIETIDADVPEYMYVGGTYSLNIVAKPLGAYGEISVSSDNPTVVETDVNGSLKAVGFGSAAIEINSSNGVVQAYIVNVYERCTEISSSADTLYLNAGMSANLNDLLTFSPAEIRIGGVEYASSNTSVVSVSPSGSVTAISAGSAVVKISLDGASVDITINVVNDGRVIESVSVQPSYTVMTPGGTLELSPVFGSADSKYKSGIWQSDDTEIVEIVGVASNGKATIRALKPGTAHVYAISSSGQSAYCTVHVNPIAIRGISVSNASAELEIGEDFNVRYTLTPANADNIGIFMYSSDTSVAAVDSDGIVTAVGAGECDIYVTNGELAAICRVSVKPISMTSASLVQTEIIGNAGESAKLEYTFEPANASPARFNWSSDNTDIAQVDAINGIVWFIAEGETWIRGTAADPSGLELIAHVRVNEIAPKALNLSADSITLKSGESAQILYSVYPANASYSQAIFESADESIASVDESGNVCAVRSGETEIYVSVGSGANKIIKIVSVTVERQSDTQYRAMIMGQFTIPGARGYLPFSLNSTRGVYDAISQSTIDASGYSIKFMPASPSLESVRSAINTLAKEADEDDVTFIYLLSHGSYTDEAGYYMQFNNGSMYYANTIINDVSKISGHVVLVLCGCHSGRVLNCKAMEAIKSNSGMYTGLNGTGHLSVICSATDTRSTYYDIDNTTLSYDFFSKAFTRVLGWDMIYDVKANVTADLNNDGSVTVSELFHAARPLTQNLISAFIQKYGTGEFFGDPNQFPASYISAEEADLVIFRR